METIEISKIILNVCLFFTLLVVFICFELFVKPFEQAGFYCSDYSVTMKYKSSTIDTSLLIIMSTVAPFVIVVVSELINKTQFNKHFTRINLSNLSVQSLKIRLFNSKLVEIKEFVANIYTNYGYYLTGLLLTTIVTLIGKKTIGRLRPNFLDVCQPDTNPYSKCNSNGEPNSMYLVPGNQFKCTSENKHELQDSRLSFPSGHSATAVGFILRLSFVLFLFNCK